MGCDDVPQSKSGLKLARHIYEKLGHEKTQAGKDWIAVKEAVLVNEQGSASRVVIDGSRSRFRIDNPSYSCSRFEIVVKFLLDFPFGVGFA